MSINTFFDAKDNITVLKLNQADSWTPTVHDVKSWSHFFQAIKSGAKLHDLRKNDRNYNVGDILLLHEYDFINGRYTGDNIKAEITYMTDNRVPCAFSSAVLDAGYCILSLRVIK